MKRFARFFKCLGSAEVVATVQSKSNEGPVKQVVLPEKYFDFSDMFDKTRADKLPEPLHYDLAIELMSGFLPNIDPSAKKRLPI